MIIKSLNILPVKSKNRFYKTICMSFFASSLELLSLGLIIPIIYFVVNPENELLIKIKLILESYSIDLTNNQLYNLLIIILIAIFFFKTFYLSFFTNYQLVFKRNLRNNLAQILFGHYLKLQYVKAIRQGFAEMQKNIDSETQRFSELILSYIMIINEFIIAFSIIIFLFFFNFEISLMVSVIFSTIFIFLYFAFKNTFKSWGIKSQEAFSSYNNTLLQSFNNLRELKLHAKEDYFIKNFSINNKLKNYYQYKQRLFSSIPRYFIELIAILLIFSILFLMIKNKNNLDYVLATLGVFAYASIKLLPTLNKLINLLGVIRFNINSSDIISNELKSLKSDLSLNSRKYFNIRNIDKIELEKIGFSFKKTILNNLSLKLEKGLIAGIYGPSGTGKTTLLDILSSLIVPDKGKIYINEQKVDPQFFFWGNSFGYISQSSVLINDGIKNNFAIGVSPESINSKKIQHSLNVVNLSQFVRDLPEGIDTMVGEKGSQISSGQKQRINIARAFYNDTKVLIMDESTNALDAENEKNIFNDIKRIKQNLIVLIVSHDKELLNRYCDDIYVLENQKLKKVK